MIQDLAKLTNLADELNVTVEEVHVENVNIIVPKSEEEDE